MHKSGKLQKQTDVSTSGTTSGKTISTIHLLPFFSHKFIQLIMHVRTVVAEHKIRTRVNSTHFGHRFLIHPSHHQQTHN